MSIKNMSNSGISHILRLYAKMMQYDNNFSSSKIKKFSSHLIYLRKLNGFDYDNFYCRLSKKYYYIHKYPIFLLNELNEPDLLNGYEELIYLLIYNWLYDEPLNPSDDNTAFSCFIDYQRKIFNKLLD